MYASNVNPGPVVLYHEQVPLILDTVLPAPATGSSADEYTIEIGDVSHHESMPNDELKLTSKYGLWAAERETTPVSHKANVVTDVLTIGRTNDHILSVAPIVRDGDQPWLGWEGDVSAVLLMNLLLPESEKNEFEDRAWFHGLNDSWQRSIRATQWIEFLCEYPEFVTPIVAHFLERERGFLKTSTEAWGLILSDQGFGFGSLTRYFAEGRLYLLISQAPQFPEELRTRAGRLFTAWEQSLIDTEVLIASWNGHESNWHTEFEELLADKEKTRELAAYLGGDCAASFEKKLAVIAAAIDAGLFHWESDIIRHAKDEARRKHESQTASTVVDLMVKKAATYMAGINALGLASDKLVSTDSRDAFAKNIVGGFLDGVLNGEIKIPGMGPGPILPFPENFTGSYKATWEVIKKIFSDPVQVLKDNPQLTAEIRSNPELLWQAKSVVSFWMNHCNKPLPDDFSLRWTCIVLLYSHLISSFAGVEQNKLLTSMRRFNSTINSYGKSHYAIDWCFLLNIYWDVHSLLFTHHTQPVEVPLAGLPKDIFKCFVVPGTYEASLGWQFYMSLGQRLSLLIGINRSPDGFDIVRVQGAKQYEKNNFKSEKIPSLPGKDKRLWSYLYRHFRESPIIGLIREVAAYLAATWPAAKLRVVNGDHHETTEKHRDYLKKKMAVKASNPDKIHRLSKKFERRMHRAQQMPEGYRGKKYDLEKLQMAIELLTIIEREITGYNTKALALGGSLSEDGVWWELP